VLYTQNGDRIVTIDAVTLFHPLYMPTCEVSPLLAAGYEVHIHTAAGAQSHHSSCNSLPRLGPDAAMQQAVAVANNMSVVSTFTPATFSPAGIHKLEHSNSRFESIQIDSFCKKIGLS